MKSILHFIFSTIELACWFVAMVEPAALVEGVDLPSVAAIELAALAGAMILHRWAWQSKEERRR